MKYNDIFLGILFIGIVLLFDISNKIFDLATQSPNQEMYLRKITNQLDDLKERFNETPHNEQEYISIKKRGDEAEFIIESYLEQLRLFRTGKIRTGLIAYFLPAFFLNYEENLFDAYREAIEKYYEEVKYYTKEEMQNLKKTLLDRHSGIIELWCKYQIKSEIFYIIEQVIAEEIVRRNNYKIPSDIYYLVREYIEYGGEDAEKTKEEQLFAQIIALEGGFRRYTLKNMIVELFITKK